MFGKLVKNLFLCSVLMGLVQFHISSANADPATVSTARDCFMPGEILPYEVFWTGIPCGEIKIEIKDLVDFGGRDAFHFVLTAESNRFLSTFFEVRDRIESFADAGELYSLRFEKSLREGDYEKEQQVVYDPGTGKAFYKEKSGEEEIQVREKTKDSLACFYLFRMIGLTAGSQMVFDVDSNKKHYRLHVTAEDEETIEIRNKGVFNTLKVVVDVERMEKDGTGGEMTEDGIVLWVTQDDARLPVKIRTKVILGEIEMVLKETYTSIKSANVLLRPQGFSKKPSAI